MAEQSWFFFSHCGPKATKMTSFQTEGKSKHHGESPNLDLFDEIENNLKLYHEHQTLGETQSRGSLSLANSSSYPASLTSSFEEAEIDSENLIHSGRFWLGEKFDLTLDRTFGFDVSDVSSNGEIRLTVQLAARSDVNTRFNVMIGSTLIANISYFQKVGICFLKLISKL